MHTLSEAEALQASADDSAAMPQVVDQVALARLYGEPLFALPQDLYIPPDALE
ncbi:MAG: segregation/condensation protein A, partial [Proteobacteria bacterium]|nr:segregation/condensation protein A [Pseudomonadota bacterium]